MRSKVLVARVGSAVRPLVEQLEARRLLSAVVQTQPIYYPAISPGAAAVPFKALNPTVTDTGTEQLVASVTGGGITAILAQVQDYGDTVKSTGQYGDTPLILYARLGNGAWHQQKINFAFDNLTDVERIGTFDQKICRKDGQMVMDPLHNLYILSSSDTTYKLRVDRITYDKLLALATDGTPVVINPDRDVMHGDYTSSFRPQIAVGMAPGGEINAYVYYGDDVLGGGAYQIWSWHGGSTDDFSHIHWNTPTNNDPNSIGGGWAPMTVGYDGKLYVPLNNKVYTMGTDAAGFTAVYPALPHDILGAPPVQPFGGGWYTTAAFVPPAGSGLTPTLWALTTNDNGLVVLASRAMDGDANASWTYSPPIDTGGAVAQPQLAVDQVTGKPSVLYASGSTLVVAALTEVTANSGVYAWSHRAVTAPISFAHISGDFGTNDHAQPQWYSASDGAGTVTWMQNDATVSGAAPSDVAAEVVDLSVLTGEAISVSGASSVELDGNAASGAVTVTADGVANSYNFGVPVVQVSVAGAGNTSLALHQTTAGTPLPAVYGVQFDNSSVGAGSLTLTGAGSTTLTPSLLATTTGEIVRTVRLRWRCGTLQPSPARSR